MRPCSRSRSRSPSRNAKKNHSSSPFPPSRPSKLSLLTKPPRKTLKKKSPRNPPSIQNLMKNAIFSSGLFDWSPWELYNPNKFAFRFIETLSRCNLMDLKYMESTSGIYWGLLPDAQIRIEDGIGGNTIGMNLAKYMIAQECIQMISFMISKEKCVIERVLGVFKIQDKGKIFYEPGFIRIYPEVSTEFCEGDIILMDLNSEFKKGFVMELLEFIETAQRIFKEFYGKEYAKLKMVFLFNNFDYVTAKRELKGYEEGLGGRVGIYYFALDWLCISLERKLKEMEDKSKEIEKQIKTMEVLIDDEGISELF